MMLGTSLGILRVYRRMLIVLGLLGLIRVIVWFGGGGRRRLLFVSFLLLCFCFVSFMTSGV